MLFFSCDQESSQIGSDFFPRGSLDISSIDTVTVELSTIKFDSLVTSSSPRTLVGTHLDDKLGRITATTYFQPSLNEASGIYASDIFFEDMSIVLKYDGYSFYDTTTVQTVHVHQLKGEMELASDGQLYNTTHFSWEDTPLGTLTFTQRPHGDDSIEIFLDKNFGQAFFSKAKEGSSDFETDERFRKYLKGFAVVADTSLSAAILGFAASLELRLYYRDRNEVPTQKKHITYTTATNYSSTQISTNRHKTKLKSLVDYRSRLPAILTDNEAYLQAGAGLTLRIDLPYLRNLKQLTNFFVTRAVLQVQSVHRSYDKFTRLPADLEVHILNGKNSSLGQYSTSATLKEDLTTGRDTYYEMDATAFVKSQMELEETNENALCFLLPDEDFRVGADRVYFANPSSLYKTRLIIYHATIQSVTK